MVTIPFCNDAGQAASDLHVHFAFLYSGRTFKWNPSGCPEPSFASVSYGYDTFLDVDWGTDCVDPGESLTIEFSYACRDVPCNTPQPFCYTWTRFGMPLYQGQGDCPFPTPTPTPTPRPTHALTLTPTATPTTTATPTPSPTPEGVTPTPPVDVQNYTYTNQTGQAASDLHIRFGGPFLPRLVQNPPGCPTPTLTTSSVGWPPNVGLVWSSACVDNGESVVIEITSEPPVYPGCFNWTIFGAPSVQPAERRRQPDRPGATSTVRAR